MIEKTEIDDKKLKQEIILNCIDYILDIPDAKERLINNIFLLAGIYHIYLKKYKKDNMNIAIKEFILNEKGYNTTLQQLYSNIL